MCETTLNKNSNESGIYDFRDLKQFLVEHDDGRNILTGCAKKMLGIKDNFANNMDYFFDNNFMEKFSESKARKLTYSPCNQHPCIDAIYTSSPFINNFHKMRQRNLIGDKELYDNLKDELKRKIDPQVLGIEETSTINLKLESQGVKEFCGEMVYIGKSSGYLKAKLHYQLENYQHLVERPEALSDEDIIESDGIYDVMVFKDQEGIFLSHGCKVFRHHVVRIWKGVNITEEVIRGSVLPMLLKRQKQKMLPAKKSMVPEQLEAVPGDVDMKAKETLTDSFDPQHTPTVLDSVCIKPVAGDVDMKTKEILTDSFDPQHTPTVPDSDCIKPVAGDVDMKAKETLTDSFDPQHKPTVPDSDCIKPVPGDVDMKTKETLTDSFDPQHKPTVPESVRIKRTPVFSFFPFVDDSCKTSLFKNQKEWLKFFGDVVSRFRKARAKGKTRLVNMIKGQQETFFRKLVTEMKYKKLDNGEVKVLSSKENKALGYEDGEGADKEEDILNEMVNMLGNDHFILPLSHRIESINIDNSDESVKMARILEQCVKARDFQPKTLDLSDEIFSHFYPRYDVEKGCLIFQPPEGVFKILIKYVDLMKGGELEGLVRRQLEEQYNKQTLFSIVERMYKYLLSKYKNGIAQRKVEIENYEKQKNQILKSDKYDLQAKVKHIRDGCRKTIQKIKIVERLSAIKLISHFKSSSSTCQYYAGQLGGKNLRALLRKCPSQGRADDCGCLYHIISALNTMKDRAFSMLQSFVKRFNEKNYSFRVDQLSCMAHMNPSEPNFKDFQLCGEKVLKHLHGDSEIQKTEIQQIKQGIEYMLGEWESFSVEKILNYDLSKLRNPKHPESSLNDSYSKSCLIDDLEKFLHFAGVDLDGKLSLNIEWRKIMLFNMGFFTDVLENRLDNLKESVKIDNFQVCQVLSVPIESELSTHLPAEKENSLCAGKRYEAFQKLKGIRQQGNEIVASDDLYKIIDDQKDWGLEVLVCSYHICTHEHHPLYCKLRCWHDYCKDEYFCLNEKNVCEHRKCTEGNPCFANICNFEYASQKAAYDDLVSKTNFFRLVEQASLAQENYIKSCTYRIDKIYMNELQKVESSGGIIEMQLLKKQSQYRKQSYLQLLFEGAVEKCLKVIYQSQEYLIKIDEAIILWQIEKYKSSIILEGQTQRNPEQNKKILSSKQSHVKRTEDKLEEDPSFIQQNILSEIESIQHSSDMRVSYLAAHHELKQEQAFNDQKTSNNQFKKEILSSYTSSERKYFDNFLMSTDAIHLEKKSFFEKMRRHDNPDLQILWDESSLPASRKEFVSGCDFVNNQIYITFKRLFLKVDKAHPNPKDDYPSVCHICRLIDERTAKTLMKFCCYCGFSVCQRCEPLIDAVFPGSRDSIDVQNSNKLLLLCPAGHEDVPLIECVTQRDKEERKSNIFIDRKIQDLFEDRRSKFWDLLDNWTSQEQRATFTNVTDFIASFQKTEKNITTRIFMNYNQYLSHCFERLHRCVEQRWMTENKVEEIPKLSCVCTGFREDATIMETNETIDTFFHSCFKQLQGQTAYFFSSDPGISDPFRGLLRIMNCQNKLEFESLKKKKIFFVTHAAALLGLDDIFGCGHSDQSFRSCGAAENRSFIDENQDLIDREKFQGVGQLIRDAPEEDPTSAIQAIAQKYWHANPGEVEEEIKAINQIIPGLEDASKRLERKFYRWELEKIQRLTSSAKERWLMNNHEQQKESNAAEQELVKKDSLNPDGQ